MDLQVCLAKVHSLGEKLTRWSVQSPNRPIDGVYNMLIDTMTLRTAFHLVAEARGADTPGIDRETCSAVRASGVDDWSLPCLPS